MPMSERLQQFLDREKVSYEVLPHPQVYTAQEVAATSHVTGWHVAKVVLVKDGEGQLLMAVIPAPSRLDVKALEKLAGKRGLSLASENDFRQVFPDCETGAMPPFGNLYGLPVYLDSTLTRSQEFVFQAGNHREVVQTRYSDFERLVQPTVGDLVQHETAKSASES